MLQHIRKFENAHIVLWLIKDTCWIQNFKLAGVIMVVPTVGMAIYITWLSRPDARELAHNLAVCCWIVANSIWMVGEFFCHDTTRQLATVFFAFGLAIIAGYYFKTLLLTKK